MFRENENTSEYREIRRDTKKMIKEHNEDTMKRKWRTREKIVKMNSKETESGNRDKTLMIIAAED